MGLSTVLVFIGLGLSAYLYIRRTDLPEKIARSFSVLHKILYHKYYVDEFYNFILIRPTLWIASKVLVGVTDAKIIEGVVNGVPGSIGRFSQRLRKVQTGLSQHYGIIMAAGAVLIIALVLLLR